MFRDALSSSFQFSVLSSPSSVFSVYSLAVTLAAGEEDDGDGDGVLRDENGEQLRACLFA